MTSTMSKTWTTEIDSDIGTLRLKVSYHLDGGSYGDYDTPPEHPSVEIQDLKLEIVTPAHDMIDALSEEIMEYEGNYDPEDYRD